MTIFIEMSDFMLMEVDFLERNRFSIYVSLSLITTEVAWGSDEASQTPTASFLVV
jgi:hypothetical protein